VKVEFDFKNGTCIYDRLFHFNPKEDLHIKLNDRVITLNNVITFPGLTNSHDHLEFNLFPFLGSKIYEDYTQWGEDTHKRNKETIQAVLTIPIALRIRWGIFKNLINGATAVVHHGGYHDLIRTFNYPVFSNYQYLHSLATEAYWKIKLNTSFRKDLMIHIGEGSGEKMHNEINDLIYWNLIKRKLIGIHAIEMDAQQGKRFKAMIWCPDSNLRLYGKTARVDTLKDSTSILFGTDSSASASSNMWEQLRVARSLRLLPDVELYRSVVTEPVKIFSSFIPASQIVAKRKSENAWDAFFELDPEDLLLIVIQHKIMLADQLYFTPDPQQYTLVKIGESEKWIVNELASVVVELKNLGVSLPLNV
jgi:hypothetical protein